MDVVFGISHADLKSYHAQDGHEKLVTKITENAKKQNRIWSCHITSSQDRPNRTPRLRTLFTSVDFFITWPLVWTLKSRAQLEHSDL